MPIKTLPDHRHFDSYRRIKLSKNPIIRLLQTRQEVDDELWCYIEYFSEIKKIGIALIKARGIKNYLSYEKAFSLFQGFVRQAKSYYYTAKGLPYRSSSLLYYYSFLNLAKAYLILVKPNKIINKKIRHGLFSGKQKSQKFSEQRIGVPRDGVFPLFYGKETGNSFPKKTNLNIVNLLSYCREIGFQYEGSGYGISKILPCFFTISWDIQNKICWGLIAINNFEKLHPYKSIITELEKNFEEISLPREVSRELFQLNGWKSKFYKFYQSKNTTAFINDDKVPSKEIEKEVKASLKKVFYGNYVPDEYDFVISLPYLPKHQFQMTEALAIYSIMFYLGDLVRYKPDYLEKLLETESAWLIESFVRTCPLTFLQIIISKILGIDYILQRI